jgi:hypothetical protein
LVLRGSQHEEMRRAPLAVGLRLTCGKILFVLPLSMLRAALVAASLVAASGASSLGADHLVAAITSSGRVLRGVVDARTDDARLWVRVQEGPAVLASSFDWQDVLAATLDGQAIDVADLRSRVGDLASAGPRIATLTPATSPESLPTPIPVTPTRRVRVRNLEILDACLVNLDRDVEPDGLTVSIAAIGDDGRPLAVRGSLQVRLFGERRPADAASLDVFEVLDDWSQRVTAVDFVDGVATYELRFRKTAPEWEFDLLPDALIEARLGAFGHGNYAASAPVIVRAFNPLRDNLQLREGTRFLPRELHGRNPSSLPEFRDGLWFNWWW